jgi:hypothetical protein
MKTMMVKNRGLNLLTTALPWLGTQPFIQTHTTSPTNNINITIKDFKNVDGQHVTSDMLVNMIKRIKSSDVYFDIFQSVLELIYFDKAHPETHSFFIPNVRCNLCRIIKNGNSYRLGNKRYL